MLIRIFAPPYDELGIKEANTERINLLCSGLTVQLNKLAKNSAKMFVIVLFTNIIYISYYIISYYIITTSLFFNVHLNIFQL